MVKSNILKLVIFLLAVSLFASCGRSDNSSEHFSKIEENTLIYKLSPYSGVLFTAAFYATDLNNNYPPHASFILEGSSSSPSVTIHEAKNSSSASSLYFEEETDFDKSLAVIASVDAKLRAPVELIFEAPKPNFMVTNSKVSVKEGDKWQDIYVLKDIESNYKQTLINATCRKVSQYAYFFVEDGYSVDSSILNEIASEFDKKYSLFIARFATPNDVDNNGKPSFLITNINSSSVMGFFYKIDMYPRGNRYGGNVISNGADVLYINIRFLSRDLWNRDKDRIIATFFHELQHMAFQSYRTNHNLGDIEDIWLNEGMSMLSEYYCGYALSHNDFILNFLRNHMHDSMTNSSYTDYGYYLLFLRYLQERFGVDIQHKLYASRNTLSYKMVEDATGLPFTEIYADFVKAVLLSGRTVIDTNIQGHTKYQITNWVHAEGTSGYNENGFNLKNLIDMTISSKRYSQNGEYYFTTSGYSAYNMHYNSLFLTRWANNVGDISFSSDYANLFYAVVEP